METEDDNLIDYSAYGTITTGGIITGSGSYMTGTGLMFSDTTTSWATQPIKNTQENYLVIPPVLDKVLKKTINGLSNVRIVEHEYLKSYFLGEDLRFIIHLELVFKWDAQLFPKDKLSEMINDAFLMTYPEMYNYKFSVKNFFVEDRDEYKEFIEFFSQNS